MPGSPSASAAGAAANQPANGENVEQARARIGRSLAGRWTLTGLLGVGGMASVYEAKHRNGRTAAVKVLHPHVSSRSSARRRFLSEGYAANKVGHPGVVLVLDDGEDGEFVFLVMELLRGHSLAERLANEGPLSVSDVVRVTGALLDALAAAHDRGVVHRDVKPSNVFELESGEIKVLDFGVAQIRDSEAQVTESGVAIGTPAFMAPEQAAGRTDEVDALTDIWAVGATMFQLLTGELVHDARSPNAAIVAAATTPAPPVQSRRSTVPDEVARVVDRALAFRRGARWPNARAMRRALLGDAEPSGFSAGTATVPDAAVAKPPRRTTRPAWRVVVLAFAAILAAAAYAFVKQTREPSWSPPAVRPSEPTVVADEPSTLAAPVAPKTQPPPTTSVPAAAAASPSASMLAPVGASTRRSPPLAPSVKRAKRRTSSTSNDDSSLIETRQ